MPGMNNSGHAFDSYKSTQIQTANQGQLIIMLYEGAIRFLGQSKEMIAEKKLDKAHNFIMKAQDIVTELMTSLDLEKGGKIAENLLSIYIYVNKRLVEANIKKDPAIIDEAAKIFNDLLISWRQVVDTPAPAASGNPKHRGGINIAG